jgi:hypothetical protein
MSATLVVTGHREFTDRRFIHGDELPPNLLPPELVDWWIDHGWAREYGADQRRSLYRLFPAFSGAKEKEQLTEAELKAYSLPP